MNASIPEYPHSACVLLGSNISPRQNIHAALLLLKQKLRLMQYSSLWRTPAVGSQGPDFLNMAVMIGTNLDIQDLKGFLRSQESRLGRIRTTDKNAPRTIDLDIIIFDGHVFEPALWDFSHIAIPVSELLPDLTDPTSGNNLASISHIHNQPGKIQLFESHHRLEEVLPCLKD